MHYFLIVGHRKDFILADRKKYVSMDKKYLKSYLELVIKVNGQQVQMQVHDILYKIQICGHEHCSFYHCLHCYAMIEITVVAGKSGNTLPSMCTNENSQN